MSKSAVRSLPRSVVIALILGAGSPAIAGQAPPGFGGIIGAILNSALTNQARQEWQNRPIVDYSCLEAHNVSADQLASNGIGPNDPRVQRMFAQCAQEAANAAKVASFARRQPPQAAHTILISSWTALLWAPLSIPTAQSTRLTSAGPAISSRASHGVRSSTP